ncbi:MAG: NADH:flavin oxidoreductase [Pirellulaceae bacterium]|nr:NADH:flavin oxidoreductase [Pirellulaceae bacterium]
MSYPKVAQLKTVARFKERMTELGINIPIDDDLLSASQSSPLASSWAFGNLKVGNRWCIHPMEGWDANRDGTPSDLTIRRWKRFGESGAKLIWGGEAAAVRHDGKANPNQTVALRSNLEGLTRLRTTLVESHKQSMGDTAGLVIGLQLTHSGRFSRPHSKTLEPRIAYHHTLLDRKFNIDPKDESIVWTDSQLEELIGNYVEGAKVARDAGFDFVDIKACHGYLLHEFLSARSRPGPYGGDLNGRTHVLRSVIKAVQRDVPELKIGVRLSIFDRPPYQMGESHGEPMPYSDLLPYGIGFGLNPENPLEVDLTEPLWVLKHLQSIGVSAVNLTVGSPYYNPHIQRPAIFPPSDGYLPPEDPMVGVARQIEVANRCKQAVPDLPLIGSAYSYLQEFLPNVAQAVVGRGMIDAVGLGRMVLSYPELPRDVLQGNKLQRKLVCRTFSDCTTGPRNGMVSGCYPLDEFYKTREEAPRIAAMRQDRDNT